ncbi:MAG: helix-turn-helix domain-containing protein [Candidatus Riflebacteria bacterium]|nr:helix-turn-helix domain-containing protein [Candidatus Riflebacteria bacterium]
MSPICIYNVFMAGRPPKNNATEFGKHLAELRKAAGLSQMAVAEALRIPQRNVSFYEREARGLPPNLLKPLAELLGVSAEEILGINEEKASKRGPKSRLERQFEEIQKLPRPKQEFISKLLGEILTANLVA